MSISVTTDNGNRTITLSYTAEADKITAVLDRAAQYIYNRLLLFPVIENGNKVPYDSLTNNQKLQLINQYVVYTMKEAANQQYIISEVEIARATATEEAEINHNIGG